MRRLKSLKSNMESDHMKPKKTRGKKTSPLPTRVYRYVLRPPTTNSELVNQRFCDTRIYYNQLVTITNVGRSKYRTARARLFPAYDALDKEVSDLAKCAKEMRQEIKLTKAEQRTRKVDPGIKARLALVTTCLKIQSDKLKLLRSEVALSPELAAASAEINDVTNNAIKALRPTLYWGTYQLCEAAIKKASSDSPYEVKYNESPPHRLKSRIGNQFIGGIVVSDLATDTQMQIVNAPEFRRSDSDKNWRARYPHDEQGHRIPCVLRFRIGSLGKQKKPLWADFPMSYHRPLPSDSRIMAAYITRQPLRERNPWQYHLCIVLESKEFEATQPLPSQQNSSVAINFGWRQMIGGQLRVAALLHKDHEPEFIELPDSFLSGLNHCKQLHSLLDEKFEIVKKELHTWISEHDCPEGFRDSFEHLLLWKSQHRLNELVRYWTEHRIPQDDIIFPTMIEWSKRFLHLRDWMTNQRRRLLRWRDDFYSVEAKKIVSRFSTIVIDNFNMSDTARKATAEEEKKGGDAASSNRFDACPSDLRARIRKAAAKYNCQIVSAPTANGTKRCNKCGTVQDVKTLEHECSRCKDQWDQDVNNTQNLHTALASGEVTPLVTPAKTSENNEFEASETVPYSVARKQLGR
jgi:hypothetical protein